MRIALLIRDLSYAGAQRQLSVLAKGLDPAEFQVTVFCFYGGPLRQELEEAGVTVCCLHKKSRWDMLGFLWRFVCAIVDSKPDILHSYLTESNVLSALLKPLLPRTRIIWGLRDSETDSDLYGLLGRLVFRLSILLSRWPDKIIANSDCGARYYAGLSFPAENISVVHNGIDCDRFKPSEEARQRIRSELGVADDEVLFGLVGRLNPVKDHATFFQAASQVTGRARFLCVGGGSGSYAESIHRLADSLPLGNRLLWSEARGDMDAIFCALDVNVSSSSAEGFSNVVGEAMACGIPAIVTDVGDSALLVGDTGLVVPPRQPEALAAAMQRFVDFGPDERVALKQKARERVEQCFNVPQLINNTSAILRQFGPAAPAGPAKVLFIITALGTGGAEMMLAQLITSLDPERFMPTVISLIGGGKHASLLRAAGISVHDLGMAAGIPSPSSLRRLTRLTQMVDPDLIVGWMYHGNVAATLASWFGKKAPVLWNVRQSLYSLALEKRGSAMVIKTLATLGSSPSHILYNSQISARQHEAIGYDEDKTVVIPNGFDTSVFKPDASARRSVYQELGLAPETVLIGRFGRNTAMKDYPSFLAAMERLQTTHPNARAIIAGTGTEQLASVPANVIVLGERNDLPRLTSALDIGCSSSAFGEGFPNVVAEALSCAVPCVVTDVGDSAWLVGTAGQVVPARDSGALANALAELLNLPRHMREAIGQQGRKRILNDFSLPAVVQQFETLLASHLRPEHSALSR